MTKLLFIFTAGLLFQDMAVAETSVDPIANFDCKYTLNNKPGQLLVSFDPSKQDNLAEAIKVSSTYANETQLGFMFPTFSPGGKFGFTFGFAVTWPIDMAAATTLFTLQDMIYGETFQKKVFGYEQYKENGEPIITEVTTMNCTLAAAAAPQK